jgi:hypothetical protein
MESLVRLGKAKYAVEAAKPTTKNESTATVAHRGFLGAGRCCCCCFGASSFTDIAVGVAIFLLE